MSNNKITSDFRKFGSAMKIVAIMSILETLIVIPLFTLIGLIYIVKAMNHIRNANIELKSSLLDKFRSLTIAAIMIRFISGILLVIWWLLFSGSEFLTSIFDLPGIIFNLFDSFSFLLLFTFIIFGIKLIQGILEIKAWDNFKSFLMNAEWIQPAINYEVKEGCDDLKKAGTSEILSFLAITIFLGWLYRMTGYFKIAKFENISKTEEITPKDVVPSQGMHSSVSHVIGEPTEIKPDIKYCPFCGTKLPSEAKYCGGCGTNLNSES
ncbi:MAG: zinc-ribbon domain-containing protein [Candidatus Lokiarchaeota archaeon]|nr:zinc-ribbon domain-containing protein [Candidatus Lokiarchaeota archaeon]MBD3199836.1 zinc-ribbon domain-containing protein [Candidatus Lokiarchaeota archaeon]